MIGTDEGLEAMRARDRQPCLCGHPNISHGSFDASGDFVGIGRAGCGNGGECACVKFEAVQ